MQYHTILFSTLILHQEVRIIETPDSLFSLINSGESLTRWYSWCWWISHSLNGSVYEFAKFKEDIYRIQYRIVVCVTVCVCICVCVFYYFRVGKIGSMYILGTINTGDSPSDDVCKRKLKVVNRKEMTRKTKILKLKPIWMLQIDKNVSLILIW